MTAYPASHLAVLKGTEKRSGFHKNHMQDLPGWQTYEGETGLNAFSRGLEHQHGFQAMSESSALCKLAERADLFGIHIFRHIL